MDKSSRRGDSVTIRVRQARPSDAEVILGFIERILEEPGIDLPMAPGEFDLTMYEEEKILEEYAASENSIFLVAEVNDRIVGVLNCKGGARKATRHATTLGISVDREWRGRGIGSALMAEAVDWARRSRVVRRIELNVFSSNAVAIHLYEKSGFEVEGHRRNAVFRDGRYEDDLIMALIPDKPE